MGKGGSSGSSEGTGLEANLRQNSFGMPSKPGRVPLGREEIAEVMFSTVKIRSGVSDPEASGER